MKKSMIPAMAIMAVGSSAFSSDFIDTAPVISSTPILERISEPRQECYTETSAAPQRPQQPQERSIMGPIVGGIAGALIGRQVGGGNGRDVATAVGAAAGAMVGDSVGNPGSQRSVTGATVGAVTGGLLGSQVGAGNGRSAATAAGTIAGAVVGDRVATRPTYTASAQPVQRCRTVESIREIIKGYNVVYRYNGREVATVLPYNPGSMVKVAVGVINDGVADYRDLPRPAPSVSRYEGYPPAGNPNYSYRY